jgi:molecular chaperone HscA
MKLYQISEPTSEENDIIVGIDLGTTNSLIGFYDGQDIKIIPDKHNTSGIVPSVIAYTAEGLKVGYEALQEKDCIKSVKRLIGKGINDVIATDQSYNIDRQNSTTSVLKLKTNSHSVTPVEISAEILKYLKNNAENYIGKKVKKAVITVPAHFDDTARTATKDAARIAGIQVMRVLNEPTAAAIAYGLNTGVTDVILVYDLGGGTFDVSILKKHNGVMVVIGTGGDNNLGGDDFDLELMKLMCTKSNMPFESITDVLGCLKISSDCKKVLSNQSSWDGDFLGHNITITNTEAISVWQKLIDKTIQITNDVLHSANLSTNNISHVILAGGGGRMPAIQNAVENLFNKQPLINIDPDTVVAIGASLHAKSLTHGGNVLVDVIPLSLGIEVIGEIVEVIIPRNTSIPIIVQKLYTTYQDNQSGFKIHIVQGEGSTIHKCRSLGRFELSGLPKKPAGEVKLEVSFKVDSDGILVVTATELESGKSCEVEVQPSYGLTESEIMHLISKG